MLLRNSGWSRELNVSFSLNLWMVLICTLYCMHRRFAFVGILWIFVFLLMNKIADIDLATITDRMAVKKAVQSGKVEDAIEKVNDLNPEVGFLFCFSPPFKSVTVHCSVLESILFLYVVSFL